MALKLKVNFVICASWHFTALKSIITCSCRIWTHTWFTVNLRNTFISMFDVMKFYVVCRRLLQVACAAIIIVILLHFFFVQPFRVWECTLAVEMTLWWNMHFISDLMIKFWEMLGNKSYKNSEWFAWISEGVCLVWFTVCTHVFTLIFHACSAVVFSLHTKLHKIL